MGLAESLRFRVLVLTVAVFAAVAIPAGIAFVHIVNSTIVKLGTLFAEKQILFDRYRGLEALTREVGLAETLARSPAIMAWARDEEDAGIRRRGLEELEHYRLAFRDRSYFFVINASGNYYFNDAADTYAGEQHRYTLTPDNPRDGWYYTTLARGPGCELNVDNDDNLGVTKVWINCMVSRQDGQPLGIVGTGIDLSTFIQQVVNSHQTGVESLFVDRSGAIQASRERDAIDFHSLTKDFEAKKTVFQRIDDAAGRTKLTQMFDEVSGGGSAARASFVRSEGRSMLVGVGWLEELGWYNVTFMDVDQIIDRRLFLPIALLLATMMLAAAVLVTWLFKRSVLDRLSRMEAAAENVEKGRFEAVVPDQHPDEIGRLSRAFARMAGAVGANTQSLEEAVRDRTHQLERLASHDMLTGIANRRGFASAFERLSHGRQASRPGLLLLDIDNFKAINDRFGHHAGDEVIEEMARRIETAIRPGDVGGRWGGDEFMVLLRDAGGQSLEDVAQRILKLVREQPFAHSGHVRTRLTTSVGGYLVEPGEGLASAGQKADAALYEAKHAGRNGFVAYRPGRSQGRTEGERVA